MSTFTYGDLVTATYILVNCKEGEHGTHPSVPLWRLVIPSPDGPAYKPHRSEAVTRDAAEQEKANTTADLIVVEQWQNGHWEEWVRWVRSGNTWRAK